MNKTADLSTTLKSARLTALIEQHDALHKIEQPTAAEIEAHHLIAEELRRRSEKHPESKDSIHKAVIEMSRLQVHVSKLSKMIGSAEVEAIAQMAMRNGTPFADVYELLTANGWILRAVPAESMDDGMEMPEESEMPEGEGESEDDDEMEMPDVPGLTTMQAALYNAYEDVVEKYGLFDQSAGAAGSHYMAAADNPFNDAGINCANCVYFRGGGACEIVSGAIEAGGACKFWIIPAEKVALRKATPREGAFVRWQSSGGIAQGQIEHVMTEGTLGVPDSSFSIEAQPDNPALLIRIWNETAEGWQPTETLVGHKASTVRQIERLAKATKTDGGNEYPAEAYAYVPDPEKPSTWKLRLWQNPEDKVTAQQVGAALAALGEGFRGNKVEIPAADLQRVKRKVLSAWREVHPDADPEEVPDVLKAEAAFIPPQSVQEEARRALNWLADGKAGSGFTDVGRARAKQLANGQSVSMSTLQRMNSYFSRHEVDQKGRGWSPSEDGYPSPGRVAWAAWGGDAGWRWAKDKLAGMEKSEFVKQVAEHRFTLAPWYIPDSEDAHGEWTDSDELQAALWDYVKKGNRDIRLQHLPNTKAGEWVEAMTMPFPVDVPMTRPDNGETISKTFPAGTVFLGVQWEDWAWDMVKSGQIRGYSIGGSAERRDEEVPGDDKTINDDD